VNPYLALAAIVAGGLYGIEEGLELEPEFVGNAYDSDKPRLPTTLREAADLFATSPVARDAFGAEVVDHYTNMARVELRRVRLGRHRLGALQGVRTPVNTERAVVNPATEEIIATITQIGGEAADEAIARSAAVLPAWRAVSPGDRARLLRRFAEAVDGANEELARLEVANSVTRSRTPAGRRATSATCLRTTQEHPSGCAGVRSRCPVAWTSPSVSRSGSWGSSCPGTSRCRSPPGASARHLPQATRSF